MTLVLAALLGYLFGSIPFGLVIARLFGLGDLRKIGSGNIGATNVLRAGNRPAALLTLILDAGKGAIAVLVLRALVDVPAGGTAGFFAVIGHIFPIYLGFRGGKGVATFLGTLGAIAWPVGLGACATWALVAAIFRYSSLAGIAAAALAPVYMLMLGSLHGAALTAILSALVIWRHRTNIARLRAGTEPKIGAK